MGVNMGVFWCHLVSGLVVVGMAAKKKADGWPRSVGFGGAVVMVDKRADGRFSLRWREAGAWKRTTRNDEGAALEWAGEKVRRLARGTGERWVSPGEGEAMEVLRRLGGGMEVSRLVAEVAAAAEVLGGVDRMRDAAEFFVNHGPGAVEVVTLGEAVRRVSLDYEKSAPATTATMETAFRGLKRILGEDRELVTVSRIEMEGWVLEEGKSKRTAVNRLGQGATFFNRCRELGLWPASRPIPTDGIRRPRLDDVAPGIFNPTEGKILLKKVVAECPRYLPYLVIAGWLGVRPSECLRLRWVDVDFTGGWIHLCPRVVGKTNRERWVKMPTAIKDLLLSYQAEMDARVCITRSREELSKLARNMGLKWPDDVLRHSAITYELQRMGGDYNAVAEWAGNSPAVIRKNYRRPIPAGWADLWNALLKGCGFL